MSATIHSSAELGVALRDRRKSLGLTQQDLAEIADVSLRFLSDLENGKDSARIGLVIEVARALGWQLELASGDAS